MKRKSMIVAALAATTLHAADDLSSMFSEGKVSGQIRAFHIDRAYDGYVNAPHRNATALGGKLKFDTADYKGLSFGTAFYTTNRILPSLELGDQSTSQVDPSLFGNGYVSQTLLGEAYINYKSGATNFKAGRQKLDTPLAGSDDARMTPNLFEAYVLSNTSIEKTTLILAHVTQFAAGSFSNIYSSGGILGATSGYSAIASNYASNQGQFTNMGIWGVNEATNGVTTAAAIYKDKGLVLQAWDYAAWNILNALYLQADMSFGDQGLKPFVSVQAIKESSLGDKLLKNVTGDGEIDSMYWALKAGAKFEGVTAYAAYSQTGANSDTDAVYKNAIISPWGGMPAFTQGMVTRHQFLAGTKATKVAASYAHEAEGRKLSTTLYYVSFDMDKNNGYSATYAWKASEAGFDVQYSPASVKNLQLRLRGNFPDKFYDSAVKTVNWSEYRLIANYNF